MKKIIFVTLTAMITSTLVAAPAVSASPATSSDDFSDVLDCYSEEGKYLAAQRTIEAKPTRKKGYANHFEPALFTVGRTFTVAGHRDVPLLKVNRWQMKSTVYVAAGKIKPVTVYIVKKDSLQYCTIQTWATAHPNAM